MKPEVYLDRLIEQREHGENPVASNDDMVAGLAAADILTQLQEIKVPPEFAHRLESSLRAHIHSHDHSWQASKAVPIARSRILVTTRRSQKRRPWIAAVGIAALLVLAFAGLVTTAAQSLPGDPLYGLKQAEHQFTLNFASDPQKRANDEIGQLHDSLIDLSNVVSGKRDDSAIRLALNTVVTRNQSSQEAVAALPAGSEHETAQQNLDSVLIQENQMFYRLLNSLDWPMKLIFTQQLGVLGQAVPEVTHIAVHPQSNGTFLITLTGMHFALSAKLMIDGQPAGYVSRNTTEQLVAIISSNSKWFAGPHTFGILNPDGTASQMTFKETGDDDNQQGGNYNRYGTPVPTRNSDN
jgi:hypothetical protein